MFNLVARATVTKTSNNYVSHVRLNSSEAGFEVSTHLSTLSRTETVRQTAQLPSSKVVGSIREQSERSSLSGFRPALSCSTHSGHKYRT